MATIDTIKQQTVLETPLCLFDLELPSGSMLRWSSHAVTIAGASYEARILEHNLFEMRGSLDEGAEQMSRVALTVSNVDGLVSQVSRSPGWKGTRLTIRFVFFDLVGGEPASESRVLFRGTASGCDQCDELSGRITFSNRLSLQRVSLPEVRIQKRCPWRFPSTAMERAASVGPTGDRYSPLFRCGYSADQAGGVGNLNGGAPFTSCDFTRSACEARGMFDRDSQGRETRRFGGVEFVPATIQVRTHGEKSTHASPVFRNEAQYDDVVPLLYGTGWVEPPVVFGRNDGNLTRIEVLLGLGPIEDVLKVVVNDIEVPEGVEGADMTGTGWYGVISKGNRTGAFNPDFQDEQGHSLGDPYGSMAFVSVVVPTRVHDGRSTPKIQVLVKGLRLETFTAGGVSEGLSFNNNPAWVLLDVLRRSGWALDELDVPSFARVAQHCGELVSVTDLNGNAVFAPRYQCNLMLDRRRSAADLVKGIRANANLCLRYNQAGVLELLAETAIGVQQAAKPSGSNASEQLLGGWPAYEFCDGSAGFSGILVRKNGSSSVRMWQRSTAETPNRYSVEFQDEFNEYQQDSLSLVDVEDARVSGQEVMGALPAAGVPNFDQAFRLMRLQLNRSIRGNQFIEFETSVRAIGVRPGDLITMTLAQAGLSRQLFRVISVSPGSNCESFRIVAQWHDDDWYGLTGEGSAGRRREPGVSGRMPRPLVGSVPRGASATDFGIEEKVIEGGDSQLIQLSASFAVPGRLSPSGVAIPLLSLTPEVEAAGGSLPGGTVFYYAVSATDASGGESPLSFSVRARTGGAGNSHRVKLKGISLSQGATGMRIYRGRSPHTLQLLDEVGPDFQYIDDGSVSAELQGPPDPNFDHANFYWRLEVQPPEEVESATATTISNSALTMTGGEYRGCTVRIVSGRGVGQERAVLDNTATQVTVAPAWSVVPEAGSEFLVCESTWHFGALGSQSPVNFLVPNRPGATVHVSGRAANSRDEECTYELSPLTRWRIMGDQNQVFDTDVPPEPLFSLSPGGQGNLILAGIAFSDLTNTRTVAAGTLVLWLTSELEAGPAAQLQAAISAAGDQIAVVPPLPLAAGSVVQAGSELLTIAEVLQAGTQFRVERGVLDSIAAPHGAGSLVRALERRVVTMAFPKDFFGSPASGSFGASLALANVSVKAAQFFVTNSHGNSPTAEACFTGSNDGGLRTLSGGQLSIQVEGVLAIEDDVAPPLVVDQALSIRDISAEVAIAPVGGAIQLRVRRDGAAIADLTIPAGSHSSNIVNGRNLGALLAGGKLSLDVMAVPQGFGTKAGADLTVTIRL